MESSNANGVPVVVFTQPITTGTAAGAHPYSAGRKALAKQLTILGSLQIVFGSLLILFQIVCIILASTYYHHGPTFIGYGIWTGTCFVITGAFGCAAGRRNNRGFMITFNVMSIISASLNSLILILAAISIDILEHIYRYRYYRDDSEYADERESAQKAALSLESLMIIMALAEVIVAIWSSVVCCKMGGCCCDCGDACCCPPAPVPTQVFWAQQPPVNGTQQQQQQQPMLLYAPVAPNSPANDVCQDNKHQKSFQYQQLMSDPNTLSTADIEIGDRARLCD